MSRRNEGGADFLAADGALLLCGHLANLAREAPQRRRDLALVAVKAFRVAPMGRETQHSLRGVLDLAAQHRG